MWILEPIRAAWCIVNPNTYWSWNIMGWKFVVWPFILCGILLLGLVQGEGFGLLSIILILSIIGYFLYRWVKTTFGEGKDINGVMAVMFAISLVVAVGFIAWLVAQIFHDGASSW
jgi:predicted membrane protein